MTRENKLALVVGFGLILLVGILVSDHLSTARTRTAADLAQVADPLADPRQEHADLIAVKSAGAAAATGRTEVAAEPADPAPPQVTGPARDPAPEIELPPVRHISLGPEEAKRLPYVIHEVARGESLSSICTSRYGDASLARELAAYNDMDDPDHVRSGARLRLPSADDLVRGRRPDEPRASGTPAPPAAPATHAEKTYTVRDGDVLTRIAERLLGSSSKYAIIFEHNRDLLDSPDDIRPGMRLKIPGDAG